MFSIAEITKDLTAIYRNKQYNVISTGSVDMLIDGKEYLLIFQMDHEHKNDVLPKAH